MNKGLTTNEAAERLGVSPARVRRLVLDKRLPAEKFGRDLVFYEADLEAFERLKGGRPPKTPQVLLTEKASKKAVNRWEGEGGALLQKKVSKKGGKK